MNIELSENISNRPEDESFQQFLTEDWGSFDRNSAKLSNKNNQEHIKKNSTTIKISEKKQSADPVDLEIAEFKISNQKMLPDNTSYEKFEDSPHSLLSRKQESPQHDVIKLHQNDQSNESLLHTPENESEKEKSQTNTSELPPILKKKNIFLIMPNNPIKIRWDYLMAVLIVYSTIVVPYRVSFVDDEKWSWIVADKIIDFLFFIDMVLCFFTAYYDQNENLMLNQKVICLRYLTTWFLFDLISILPFEFMIDFNTQYTTLVRASRLPKMYKVTRFAKVVQTVRKGSNQNSIWTKIYNLILINEGVARLSLYIFSLCIFCHLMTCIFYLQAVLNGTPNSWIYQTQNIDNPNHYKYIVSLYWILQTAITVGYGDIKITTIPERIIACIAMGAGVLFFAIVVGSMSSIISELDVKSNMYEQKVIYLSQMKETFGLSATLIKRVKKCIKKKIFKDKKSADLNSFPVNIRVELLLQINKDKISGIKFFQRQPRKFVAEVSSCLEILNLKKYDYIFIEGEPSNELYFIQKGKVSYVIKNLDNFPFLTFNEGNYFGEVELLFDDSYKYSAIADEDCQLVWMDKKNVVKLFSEEFASVGKPFYRMALQRKTIIKKNYKAAKCFCKSEEYKLHFNSITVADVTTNRFINQCDMKVENNQMNLQENVEPHNAVDEIFVDGDIMKKKLQLTEEKLAIAEKDFDLLMKILEDIQSIKQFILLIILKSQNFK